MPSVLLTGRHFLKISMRCRLALRRPTSWYFRARSPKCRWPFLSPRRWWGRTLLLRRTSRQEESRLRKVREAKAFSTRPPIVSHVWNTRVCVSIYIYIRPCSTFPRSSSLKSSAERHRSGTFKTSPLEVFLSLPPKVFLSLLPFFCSSTSAPRPPFYFFPQHGNQKPGSPTFLCHQGVCLSSEHTPMSNTRPRADNAQGWRTPPPLPPLQFPQKFLSFMIICCLPPP